MLIGTIVHFQTESPRDSWSSQEGDAQTLTMPIYFWHEATEIATGKNVMKDFRGREEFKTPLDFIRAGWEPLMPPAKGYSGPGDSRLHWWMVQRREG